MYSIEGSLSLFPSLFQSILANLLRSLHRTWRRERDIKCTWIYIYILCIILSYDMNNFTYLLFLFYTLLTCTTTNYEKSVCVYFLWYIFSQVIPKERKKECVSSHMVRDQSTKTVKESMCLRSLMVRVQSTYTRKETVRERQRALRWPRVFDALRRVRERIDWIRLEEMKIDWIRLEIKNESWKRV